jgi:hypothetical protein
LPARRPIRPIWTALTTRQQGFAEGGALARRYPPAVGPFTDMTDMSPRGFVCDPFGKLVNILAHG